MYELCMMHYLNNLKLRMKCNFSKYVCDAHPSLGSASLSLIWLITLLALKTCYGLARLSVKLGIELCSLSLAGVHDAFF